MFPLAKKSEQGKEQIKYLEKLKKVWWRYQLGENVASLAQREKPQGRCKGGNCQLRGESFIMEVMVIMALGETEIQMGEGGWWLEEGPLTDVSHGNLNSLQIISTFSLGC